MSFQCIFKLHKRTSFLQKVNLTTSPFSAELKIHMKLCVTEPDFLVNFFPKKMVKTRIFWIYRKIWSLIYVNLFYSESFYYLLYSYTNIIFQENLVPKILAKMLSANQVAEFLISYISRTKWWNSLMFCMLVQIYRDQKWIEK